MRTILLTGDNQAVADSVATQLGIDTAIADVLPDGKVNVIRQPATKAIRSRWSGRDQ
ncbi:haloacid dehalogenase-like hydrolase family protein [Mycobacterium ulcerans str. Harvey]|uniref:Haloacid dehalogenase-like hydrolase family protein n=1 Tax=Mycobacterium ulcerans str. Harvey TaxID=1299332 RepID=A0ABN0RAK3_MYCUL|nr:haloacid dehalogenase-like hydrolase family protein [Mycobacterium ulcerans str. Harvey]